MRNPCLTDYATLLLRKRVKSSIMSKCHRVIRHLVNHKILKIYEKEIGRNARCFWIVIIQIPEGKVLI